MQIHMTVRHDTLAPSDKLYMEERIKKFDHFDSHVNEVHIVVLTEKFRHQTELVALGKHVRLSALVTADHVRESFDMAFEKLKRQLKKHHERERTELRRRAPHRPAAR